MATMTQDKKKELAQRIRIAATWVAGEREVELLAIAAEIEGEDAEQARESAIEQVSVTYDVPAEVSTGARPFNETKAFAEAAAADEAVVEEARKKVETTELPKKK